MRFQIDDLAGFAGWEKSMTTFAKAVNYPINPAVYMNGDDHYDAPRVFSNVYEWTGDSKWADKVAIAVQRQLSYYIPSGFGVPGYFHYTSGLTKNYADTGNKQARAAAIGLSVYAAYSTSITGGERENAYAIISHLNAEDLGRGHREIIHNQIDLALSHIAMSIDDPPGSRPPTKYVQAFMLGLVCEALIAYWDRYRDERIPDRIKATVDWLWNNMWLPDANAFMYIDRDVAEGGRYPAPPLNLLIAPAYAWVYRQTGDRSYRDKHDAIFNGSNAATGSIWSQKEYNQCFRWSTQGLKWRQQGDVALPRATTLSVKTFDVNVLPNNWSDRFLVLIPDGTRLEGAVTITPNDSGRNGKFYPPTAIITTDHPTAMFHYRPSGGDGTRTINFNNTGQLVNQSRTILWCKYPVPIAKTYTMQEPIIGKVNEPLDLVISLDPPQAAPPLSADDMGGLIFVEANAGSYDSGASSGFRNSEIRDEYNVQGAFYRFCIGGGMPKYIKFIPQTIGDKKALLSDTAGLDDPPQFIYRVIA